MKTVLSAQNGAEVTENSISEQLAEILPQLSKNQLRFVAEMQEAVSKKDAAEAIGLKADTVYRWPAIVDEAIDLVAAEAVAAAARVLTQNALKAALIKVAGMDSTDEKVQQAAASEVLDRTQGKAVQKQETEHRFPGMNLDAFHAALQEYQEAGDGAD